MKNIETDTDPYHCRQFGRLTLDFDFNNVFNFNLMKVW